VSRLILICGIVLSIVTIGGCSCAAMGICTCSPTTELKWEPQTLQARFSNPDTARDQCINAEYAQCVKATALLCKDKQYSSIKHPITGDPVAANVAKAVCSEAEDEIARNSLKDVDHIGLCKPLVPEQIQACMKGKGFEGVYIDKEACAIKFM